MDNMKNLKESIVVYILKCNTFNAVGKTEKILSHRVNEHEKRNSSACIQHLTANPTHVIGFKNEKFLYTTENDFQLLPNATILKMVAWHRRPNR